MSIHTSTLTVGFGPKTGTVLPKKLLAKDYTFPVAAKAGLWNLFKVPALTRLLFAKKHHWDIHCPPANGDRQDPQLNIHPRDGTFCDAILCLQTTNLTYYTHGENQTQARQLKGMCTILLDDKISVHNGQQILKYTISMAVWCCSDLVIFGELTCH